MSTFGENEKDEDWKIFNVLSKDLAETSRIHNQMSNINETLGSVELELQNCKNYLERCLLDKECLRKQNTSQSIELNRLQQEKEYLEMQQHDLKREIEEVKDKLRASNENLDSAIANCTQKDSTVCQLRDEVRVKDEILQRIQTEHKQMLKSLSVMLSKPTHYVDTIETAIKTRIFEILNENRDKEAEIESLQKQLTDKSHQLSKQILINNKLHSRIRVLENENHNLESTLYQSEAAINEYNLTVEGLKRDKASFTNFLQRLMKILNMEEISNDTLGTDLHTESLLLRAEQLTRMERDKLVDKTALVYQLQRKIRLLREQIQRKDLHLDLLRKKLTLQEESTATKCMLINERDEANKRIKKLLREVDRLQNELGDCRYQIKNLNSQLAEATDYKITSLEQGKKNEELQKRIIDYETLRRKYNNKLTFLKNQLNTTGETIEQERTINEQTLHLLRNEVAKLKNSLMDAQRREQQLLHFKQAVAKIMGVSYTIPNHELISRLQKLVDAHHDFTTISRRYDDPVLRLTTKSPSGGRYTRISDRYDDSGYTDANLDDSDDNLFKLQTGSHYI